MHWIPPSRILPKGSGSKPTLPGVSQVRGQSGCAVLRTIWKTNLPSQHFPPVDLRSFRKTPREVPGGTAGKKCVRVCWFLALTSSGAPTFARYGERTRTRTRARAAAGRGCGGAGSCRMEHSAGARAERWTAPVRRRRACPLPCRRRPARGSPPGAAHTGAGGSAGRTCALVCGACGGPGGAGALVRGRLQGGAAQLRGDTRRAQCDVWEV